MALDEDPPSSLDLIWATPVCNVQNSCRGLTKQVSKLNVIHDENKIPSSLSVYVLRLSIRNIAYWHSIPPFALPKPLFPNVRKMYFSFAILVIFN